MRLKKLNFLENIDTKTLEDSTIWKIFFSKEIISSVENLKIESEQRFDNQFESVGLGNYNLQASSQTSFEKSPPHWVFVVIAIRNGQ